MTHRKALLGRQTHGAVPDTVLPNANYRSGVRLDLNSTSLTSTVYETPNSDFVIRHEEITLTNKFLVKQLLLDLQHRKLLYLATPEFSRINKSDATSPTNKHKYVSKEAKNVFVNKQQVKNLRMNELTKVKCLQKRQVHAARRKERKLNPVVGRDVRKRITKQKVTDSSFSGIVEGSAFRASVNSISPVVSNSANPSAGSVAKAPQGHSMPTVNVVSSDVAMDIMGDLVDLMSSARPGTVPNYNLLLQNAMSTMNGMRPGVGSLASMTGDIPPDSNLDMQSAYHKFGPYSQYGISPPLAVSRNRPPYSTYDTLNYGGHGDQPHHRQGVDYDYGMAGKSAGNAGQPRRSTVNRASRVKGLNSATPSLAGVGHGGPLAEISSKTSSSDWILGSPKATVSSVTERNQQTAEGMRRIDSILTKLENALAKINDAKGLLKMYPFLKGLIEIGLRNPGMNLQDVLREITTSAPKTFQQQTSNGMHGTAAVSVRNRSVQVGLSSVGATRENKKTFFSVPSYTYDKVRETGPAMWHLIDPAYMACYALNTNDYQSPINIRLKHVQYDAETPIPIYTRDRRPIDATFINDGRVPRLVMQSSNGLISGIPQHAADRFRLVEAHIHYGSKPRVGSEHTVNNGYFEGEIQYYHYNTKYASMEEAEQKTDGIAVVAFFVEETNFTSHGIDQLLQHTHLIRYPGDSVNVTVVADDLLPPTMFDKFVYYRGSLTVPPCSRDVSWILISEPVPVSSRQLQELRSLYADKDGRTTIGDYGNARPLQPINSRIIRSNFPLLIY